MKYLMKFMMLIGILGVFIGAKAQVQAAVQYETESNDSYTTADLIALGNSVTGQISENDKGDYYKIIAPANGKIDLVFQHKYKDDDKEWSIMIYQYINGQYNELSNETINVRDNESITLPFIGAVENGVYYLKVSNKWYMDEERYTIQSSFSPSEYCEKESNNDYYLANNIDLNNSYTGTLSGGQDEDYYKIIAPDNGKINIYFQHKYKDEDKRWGVKIYQYINGQYNELSNQTINVRDGENIALPFIGAIKNGTYFIQITDHNWYGAVGENYIIKTSFTQSDIFEKEPNDDYYSATEISLNQKYGGTINNGYDKDFYHFVASLNGTLCIDFQHTYIDENGSWYVDIYNYVNGEYVQIVSKRIRQTDSKIITLPDIEVVNGRHYYIIVKNNRNVNGEEYFVKAYMKPKIIKVSKIQLSCSSKKIAAGNKVRIKASVSPSNATNKGIIWSSSNSKVAKVNQKGVVTFKKNSGGKSVTITATASDGGGAKASIKLKSMRGKVKKIIIKGKKKVKAGKSCKLRAEVKATQGANTRIKWSSSNTKYATVSSSGKVKAKKAGKGKIVKITARATDGSGKKCVVKVRIK